MIKAVFLDAGLTLIYAEPALAGRAVEVARSFGIPLEAEQIEAVAPRAMRHLAETQARDPDLYSSDERVAGLWQSYFAHVLREAGAAGEAARIEECAATLYAQFNAPGAWALFPDVLPTLDELHQEGYTIGVISDWASTLSSGILLPLGLGKYVDFMVISAVQRQAKPAVGLYEEALARAGVEPHEAVHIGDNYVTDVLGARAAGIEGILLDRHNHHDVPLDCPRITGLAELLPWLRTHRTSS